jgi:hypothetical protein
VSLVVAASADCEEDEALAAAAAVRARFGAIAERGRVTRIFYTPRPRDVGPTCLAVYRGGPGC